MGDVLLLHIPLGIVKCQTSWKTMFSIQKWMSELNSELQLAESLNLHTQNCRHNTAGNHCEKCLGGFHGNNAVDGHAVSCSSCPCPLQVASNKSVPLFHHLDNSFSISCYSRTYFCFIDLLVPVYVPGNPKYLYHSQSKGCLSV